jgi:hypothetical protein
VSYLDVPTASGASTPDDPAYVCRTLGNNNGNILYTGRLQPNSWASGAVQCIMSHRLAGGASGSRFWIGLTAAGVIEFDFYTNTPGVITATCPAPGWTAGSEHWLQVLYNLNSGTVNFRTSTDGGITFVDITPQITGLGSTPQATAGTAPAIRIGTDLDNNHMPGRILFTRLWFNSVQVFDMDWTTQIPGSLGPWLDPSIAGSVSNNETWTRIGTASIAGTLQIAAAPAAVNPTQRLGCGDARAEVWTRGGGTRVIDLPNITAVEWNRVRSDTSLGSVTMDGVAIASDPECCAVLDTVRPWKHELHIYRDDKRAWLGPIQEIALNGPSLQIKARDVSAWLDKRFVHFTHQWGGAQANQGSENSDVLLLALALDGASVETGFIGVTGQIFQRVGVNGAKPLDLMQRTYTPAQFKPVGPEIRDMAKGALDWTVIGRMGYVNHATWTQVLPNPVQNPSFETTTSPWSGFARDTSVFHSGVAGARCSTPSPNVSGTMDGLVVGKNYQLRCWLRGTSNALDAGQKSNDDGVVKVGNDESSVFSWYVYGQPTGANADNRGRTNWIQIGVFFTATATTMPITITATGSPIDSSLIYFDDFEVWQQVPSFTLRDYSLAEPAKIALSGLDQVNRAIVANQQSGGDYAFYKEAPKPSWFLGSTTPPGGAGNFTAEQAEFGLLEGLSTQPLADAAGAQGSATQKTSSLASTPLVLDKIILDPNAGVTMDQLIPGVLFTLRLDEPCFTVQADLVLQSVTVKTTPLQGEQVELGFEPSGF